MRTILAQIELKSTKSIRSVTYSAYYTIDITHDVICNIYDYTVIPGSDSVLWKLALAMASFFFFFFFFLQIFFFFF